MVKASSIAVDLVDVQSNTYIDDTELRTGSGTLHFELSNSGLWPFVKYAVQYLNDELQQMLKFNVQ
jgi:hypothetical protein